MANYKNSNYLFITGNQTVPASANGTGTIQTVGNKVIGTGTLFLTEMPAGSWLVDLSQDEIRRVVFDSTETNTQATLEQAFTSDIAALTTPNIISKEDANVVSISVQIPAGQDNGTLDGQNFPSGTSVTFSKDSRDRSSARDLIDPVIVDATDTQMQILILK